MDFGKAEDLSKIDFTLPDDHHDTDVILASLKKKKNKTKVHIGCAKWGRKEWVGKIYPLKTKEKDFLSIYVKQFNTIELNATHYRIFGSETIKKWKSLAPLEFRFCPKFYQSISHFKRLKNCERETELFYDSIRNFGENLGECFLQLPPNYPPKNLADMEKYLKSLPNDIPVCVELRHPDWFKDGEVSDNTFNIFKELGIGSVITDTSGRRDVVHMRLTNGTAFIRFVGNNLHKTDYTRIDDWVQRLKHWLNSGLETLYFMLHQHDEQYTPELIAYTIKEFNKHCKLSLKEPDFLS
jgi:uncharacterized protein YecE (DUF72 family)